MNIERSSKIKEKNNVSVSLVKLQNHIEVRKSNTGKYSW